jgi:hypothetical protein
MLTPSYHAWESMSKAHLAALDPTTIKHIDTSFTRMARRFREPDEERRWKNKGAASDGANSGTGLNEGDEESEREEVGRALGLRWERRDWRSR